MCDEWLTEIIRKATAGVGADYFRVAIGGSEPIYRERVYCYELYHQMRCRWPKETRLLVQGELDKSGNQNFPPELGKVPDFLIHTPASMKNNYAIIEVKPSSADPGNIDNDLKKLSLFQSQVGYQYAIYLIYGDEAADFAEHVKEIAEKVQEFKLEPIELWLHEKSGEPAACHATLPAD